MGPVVLEGPELPPLEDIIGRKGWEKGAKIGLMMVNSGKC